MKKISQNWTLIVSSILFGIFVLNILLGKTALVFQWQVPTFNDVGEFLILFISVIFFVVYTLYKK